MARLSAVVLVLVVSCALSVRAAGILDLLWAFDDADEERQGTEEISSTTTTDRACSCEGPGCMCCADFNFTYIDLGGPGCVQMTYISPAEGINVNISYGDSVLLSQSIKGANPDPACLELIGGLAQMCARFSDLAPTSDGLRWCLQLEPGVLGETQVQLPLGCFRMGPGGMVPDPPSNGTAAPVNGTTTEEDLNEDALIAAVNESAEQGISFLSNLLGLYTSGGLTDSGSSATNSSSSTQSSSSSPSEEESQQVSSSNATDSARSNNIPS